MRYIKIICGTAYCGTENTEYIKTDMTNEQLDSYMSDVAADNASSYEYLVYGWDNSPESYAEEEGISVEEAEGMMEEYYAEAYANWEEITEEEYKEGTDIF